MPAASADGATADAAEDGVEGPVGGVLGAEGVDEVAGSGTEDAAEDGVEGLVGGGCEEARELPPPREAARGAARSVSRLRLAPWQHHARSSRGRRTQAAAASMGLGREGKGMTPKSPRP